MEAANDLPARTASTSVRKILLNSPPSTRSAEDRQAAIERQTGGEQCGELAGKLQKLLLADLAPSRQQRLAHRSRDRALARQRDAQRDTAHLAQAQDHALLGVGFDHAFDDLSRLIGGAILKKSHLSALPLAPAHFGFSNLGFVRFVREVLQASQTHKSVNLN